MIIAIAEARSPCVVCALINAFSVLERCFAPVTEAEKYVFLACQTKIYCASYLFLFNYLHQALKFAVDVYVQQFFRLCDSIFAERVTRKIFRKSCGA